MTQEHRLRAGEGEEARLGPGEGGQAEVWSRGFLPLRCRSEPRHHARPAFPGSALEIGGTVYEVLSETELPRQGRVVYRLRPWPEGEVVRDRAVWGPTFVRQAEAERERARVRRRARPLRFLLYPLVGLLPEEEQERVCDRLGLYAVTATLVSGLGESLVVLTALTLVARASSGPGAIAFFLALPVIVLLVLPGLLRAFAAGFLRETGGSAPLVLAFGLLRRIGAVRLRRDVGFVPLTRTAFWDRLRRCDAVATDPDGTLVYRSLLPHLTWTASHSLQAGDDFWSVSPLAPQLEGGRLVYSYRLAPLGEAPAPGTPASRPPEPSAYADEVVGGVRIEWDSFNRAFSWLTSMLAVEVQARAFEHRGGPAAARGPTIVSATASAVLALYLASFLPGPAADPLAPFVAVFAGVLLLDALLRSRRLRQRRYAASLLRFLLPSDTLPPERVAYHAHRDAERAALRQLCPA